MNLWSGCLLYLIGLGIIFAIVIWISSVTGISIAWIWIGLLVLIFGLGGVMHD